MKIVHGIVYVLESGRGGPVKIGFTAHRLEDRVHELQTGNPEPLVILAWGHGSVDDEQWLHVLFEDSKIRGEWFRRTPDVEWFIARLRSGFPHGLPQYAGRPLHVAVVVSDLIERVVAA